MLIYFKSIAKAILSLPVDQEINVFYWPRYQQFIFPAITKEIQYMFDKMNEEHDDIKTCELYCIVELGMLK